MPYLILKDVSEFLAFTQKVFGAEVKMKHTDDDGRIVHGEEAKAYREAMDSEMGWTYILEKFKKTTQVQAT